MRTTDVKYEYLYLNLFQKYLWSCLLSFNLKWLMKVSHKKLTKIKFYWMRPVRGFVNINTPHHQTHNRYIYRSDLTVNFCWRLLIPIYYVLFKNNSFWVNNMTQTINKKTIKNNSLVLPETIEFSWGVKSK